ncbi:MAG TPA: type I restriction endonuclease subunit R [Spirochaetota bacterium]|nr:type I restriction endonuclease subunit R [Spirochaetota bacterium]
MSTQSEQQLEEQLVAKCVSLGYHLIRIEDESALLANFKSQLEKHNNITLSKSEFERILINISKGSIFEKAKTLREKQHIQRDDGDNLYYELLNTECWTDNEFQVTHQVTVEGTYKNRYDVTLLINGLPLVQIELKRRGLELKEAFNQINRYQKHSFGANSALFQYVQIFVISNGVNTKYYANSRNKVSSESFKQTFYWTDNKNKRINELISFAENFLNPDHCAKMICKYIVLNETNKALMILRPYQYYAVESIIDRVKNSTKNGYIWHTTGSGKTLTSFKASQVLMKLPQVKKVVFVVDRKDLDNQTIREFNSFRKDSVDPTSDTKGLVKQFSEDTSLIVTTIQKLNNAISKAKHLLKMDKLKDDRIVFIFDECHRTQFGETHSNIKNFFNNNQMFGFTGTPIFADNAVKNEKGKRTTKELFEECLHQYVITDAIKDENVLKFAVEYVGRYKEKKGNKTDVDIEVEAIDTQELMDHPSRLEKIVDYIIANHDRKTHNREYNAIFCVSSIENLVKYYNIFQTKKEAGQHNLKIATIFSYTANEEDPDANGIIPEDLMIASEGKSDYGNSLHNRDHLERFIGHYNSMFGMNYTTKDSESFYNYYKDISDKTKNRQIDILLVVNMYLTGFDSKFLNTLYVDKNLKHHGLIQAYSRTNRILNEQKSQGNIVVFRNLKNATDEAITLFGNKEAIEVILMQPYDDYVKSFNEAALKLLEITPTIKSVDALESEEDEMAYIVAFRNLLRLKNILVTFTDFKWEDLTIDEQLFTDHISKYRDLYDKVKSNHQKEKVSILEDVDFELELIHRDEINVSYILQLIIKMKNKSQDDFTHMERAINNLLDTDALLRSKRELIKKFIADNLPVIEDSEDIPDEFEKFWDEEKQKAFMTFVKEENLSLDKTTNLIENYLFTEREPLRDEILDLIEGEQPSILERKSTGERILNKIFQFVNTFIHDIAI